LYGVVFITEYEIAQFWKDHSPIKEGHGGIVPLMNPGHIFHSVNTIDTVNVDDTVDPVSGTVPRLSSRFTVSHCEKRQVKDQEKDK
jgi:hypothetical protein